MRKMKLTTWILIAMLAGIGVGWMCHELLPTPESAKTVAGYISLITDVFLRLIKMIIAPLVFSTLVVGIAHMGDTKSLGRIGIKTMGWFITASLFSLLCGQAGRTPSLATVEKPAAWTMRRTMRLSRAP